MAMDLNFFETLFDRQLTDKRQVANINELEQTIYRLVIELGRKQIEEILVQADAQLGAGTECPHCGGSHTQSKGKDQRLLKTRLGEVHLTRQRLVCRDCQTSFYPLDEQLGVERSENVTLNLRKLALACGSSWPYETAAEVVAELTGAPLDPSEIQRLVEKEGEELKKKGTK